MFRGGGGGVGHAPHKGYKISISIVNYINRYPDYYIDISTIHNVWLSSSNDPAESLSPDVTIL